MSAVVSCMSIHERRSRALDVEHQVVTLSTALVGTAGLSPRREAELVGAGNERLRALVEAVEQATIAAAALELEERAADEHVQVCSVCSRGRLLVRGVCRGFRRIRASIDRAHDRYRRTMRRLGRA